MSCALIIGLLNAIGGRGWFPHDRLIFRFLAPVALLWGYGGWEFGLCAAIAYGLWFPFGWSFDEITGKHDAKKYPVVIQNIGKALFPYDGFHATNRKRGIVMKCLRGMYGYPGFVAVAYLNPLSLLYGLLWGLQGVIYWTCGRLTQRYAVPLAETTDGAVKAMAIMGALYGAA